MIGSPDEEHLARVGLSLVAEPGDAAFGAWVNEVGAVAAWHDLAQGRCPLRRRESHLARVASAVPPAAVLETAEAAGLHLLLPGTRAWPTQLDDLGARAPLLLWSRGPAPLRESLLCSVAVVGARAASAYGTFVASELAADLADRGWTVVSGGAYGIDAAAHSGSLAVEGVTVAVLANGADVFYPRSNDALLARVADSGVVVSELPPGARPTRPRFLERNRVVAALTRGTVVVEAANRSGALSTAHRATELNRPVMAVPGAVTSAPSTGCHRLIRDGEAVLVTGVADVLELVGSMGEQSAPADPRLDDVHAQLAPRRPRSLADLADRCGLPAPELLGRLGELRDLGLAERIDGGWLARRPPPR